jgi:hypothetical protein
MTATMDSVGDARIRNPLEPPLQPACYDLLDGGQNCGISIPSIQPAEFVDHEALLQKSLHLKPEPYRHNLRE